MKKKNFIVVVVLFASVGVSLLVATFATNTPDSGSFSPDFEHEHGDHHSGNSVYFVPEHRIKITGLDSELVKNLTHTADQNTIRFQTGFAPYGEVDISGQPISSSQQCVDDVFSVDLVEKKEPGAIRIKGGSTTVFVVRKIPGEFCFQYSFFGDALHFSEDLLSRLMQGMEFDQ